MTRVLTGATVLLIVSCVTAASGAAATAAPVTGSGTSVAQTADSRITPAARKRPDGLQIRIVLKGKRFGKLATVKIKGVKGRAKGAIGSVRLKNRTTVMGVYPGTYKITAKRIRKSGRVAKPVVRKRWVKVTRRRGATVVFHYRAAGRGPAAKPAPRRKSSKRSSVGSRNGDVLARGQRYCADGYTGHNNYFGNSPSKWVADINFYGDRRAPLYAPAAGWVSKVTSAKRSGWGNSIVWTSADGSRKLHLAHLASVTATGWVAAGAQVGTIGATGVTSSSHLHISHAVNGRPAPVVLSGVTIRPAFKAPFYGSINPCNGTTYTSAGPSR